MYISSKMDKAVCSSWVVVEFTEDDAPEAALDEPMEKQSMPALTQWLGHWDANQYKERQATGQAHRFCILYGITEWIAISWSCQHIHPFHTCWIMHWWANWKGGWMKVETYINRNNHCPSSDTVFIYSKVLTPKSWHAHATNHLQTWERANIGNLLPRFFYVEEFKMHIWWQFKSEYLRKHTHGCPWYCALYIYRLVSIQPLSPLTFCNQNIRPSNNRPNNLAMSQLHAQGGVNHFNFKPKLTWVM